MTVAGQIPEYLPDRVRVHYRIAASDLNGYGLMHGGRLLTLCDEVAYLAARRHVDAICLTRAVHRARFHQGLRAESLIDISARLGLVGHSSLWVAVEVTPPSPGSLDAEASRAAMDAVFVFAAVDRNLRPVSVPPLKQKDVDPVLAQRLGRLRDSLGKS